MYGTSSGSSIRFGNRGEPSHLGGSSDFSRRTITASSCLRSGVRAAGEPLVVEQFQQGREALRVAVVRRGGQEELVLEVREPAGAGPAVRSESVAYLPRPDGAQLWASSTISRSNLRG